MLIGDMYSEKCSSISMTSSRVMPDDVDARRRPKPQRDPVAQLSSRQRRRCRAAGIDVHLSVATIECEPQRHASAAASPSRTGSPGPRLSSRCDRRRAATATRMPPSLKRSPDWTRREQQERALRAEQVGHAHRAQLRAVEAIRRKRDRHAQDRCSRCGARRGSSRTASTSAAGAARAARSGMR